MSSLSHVGLRMVSGYQYLECIIGWLTAPVLACSACCSNVFAHWLWFVNMAGLASKLLMWLHSLFVLIARSTLTLLFPAHLVVAGLEEWNEGIWRLHPRRLQVVMVMKKRRMMIRGIVWDFFHVFFHLDWQRELFQTVYLWCSRANKIYQNLYLYPI